MLSKAGENLSESKRIGLGSDISLREGGPADTKNKLMRDSGWNCWFRPNMISELCADFPIFLKLKLKMYVSTAVAYLTFFNTCICWDNDDASCLTRFPDDELCITAIININIIIFIIIFIM